MISLVLIDLPLRVCVLGTSVRLHDYPQGHMTGAMVRTSASIVLPRTASSPLYPVVADSDQCVFDIVLQNVI